MPSRRVFIRGRWFLNVLIAFTLGLSFLISGSGAVSPVFAGTGSMAYNASANIIGASCATSSIGISWTFTGTSNDFTTDGIPQDAVDVVLYDGSGIIHGRIPLLQESSTS